MITNSVSPACRAALSHKRDGRIFVVEGTLTATKRGSARPNEQYWLCGTCSQNLKLVVEKRRVTTVPIERETATLAG